MNPTPSSQAPITARIFTDPACPYGYSASPWLRAVEWRYRDQIEWQLVTITLWEPNKPSKNTTIRSADHWIDLRERYGMPFVAEPKLRPITTERACQAIVASRLIQPGSQWRVLRALQLLFFNTPLLLDDDDQLRAALSSVEGLEADRMVASLDSPEVQAAWREDWNETRTAENGPTHFQGKSSETSDGIRYSAPSIIFSSGDGRCEAGGFQPVEVYDAAVANLNPGLKRHAPPESPLEALVLYPGGLATQEIAQIMTDGNDAPDRLETEHQLVRLLGDRKVRRIAMGNDAIWLAA
ncbi:MAG: DsbA family protein [Solirubrobacterales bacterium]|nr:DsbA family protein [Solirubrobacterales bacterium]